MTIQQLERRRFLTISVNAAGNVNITGTAGDDDVAIDYDVETDFLDIRVNDEFDRVQAIPTRRLRIFLLDGNDTLVCSALGFEPVTVYGGAGDDQISVFSDVNQFGNGARAYGDDGADRITVGGANDTAYGGGGKDRIDLGEGNDRAFGGGGNDIIRGFFGNDVLAGETGNDSITGSGGRDQLFGSVGDDTLHGGGGNDTLMGNSDNDDLDGAEGNDTLAGGGGLDSIIGGAGADRFTDLFNGPDRGNDFNDEEDLLASDP